MPIRSQRVERIDTHISTVLLAGDFAYKIKKPVDLGFLDFSSLEKRHRFCLEELRLNRRTAPRAVSRRRSDRRDVRRAARRRRSAATRSSTRSGCVASTRAARWITWLPAGS